MLTDEWLRDLEAKEVEQGRGVKGWVDEASLVDRGGGGGGGGR